MLQKIQNTIPNLSNITSLKINLRTIKIVEKYKNEFNLLNSFQTLLTSLN